MAWQYGLVVAPLPLAHLGARLMFSGSGLRLPSTSTFDASPFVTAASIGLVGLMSYEGYAAVQRRRAGIRSEDPRGVPIASRLPLLAATSSGLLPPTLFLAPLPFMPPFLMVASPIACGLG